MTKRVYFVAHGGTVQGVGFRYFTRKKAQAYGLTGWCRNTSDNKVEGEAQGDDAQVDKLMQDVDRGPSSAIVVKLTQELREVINDDVEFAVRH
ncbi:hypothetical protein NQ176_g10285 [Zarea fungicola]|uniref:Uncharacterized protein n=1 Tax=Zarea fungicola TaxID=93591 RepID=A0ACC1MH78_9HYPO|nr:hypothetical protein NQ176_g10285 [Lecanicillium fungicola]